MRSRSLPVPRNSRGLAESSGTFCGRGQPGVLQGGGRARTMAVARRAVDPPRLEAHAQGCPLSAFPSWSSAGTRVRSPKREVCRVISLPALWLRSARSHHPLPLPPLHFCPWPRVSFKITAPRFWSPFNLSPDMSFQKRKRIGLLLGTVTVLQHFSS